MSTAAVKIGSDNYVYLLRGSGTYDFYRYNTATDVWDITLPTAPGGASTKAYKNGSSITYDGNDTIYCLKGSYNEFAAYSVSGKTWVTKDPLPLAAPPSTKKKKVKDGSGAAYAGKTVYALKGGNTDEFWTYKCDSHKWFTGLPVPAGIKKVKGGGGLVYASGNKTCYALRGNNTREFWAYIMLTDDAPPGFNSGVMSSAELRKTDYGLRIGPNPFTKATFISYTLPQAANVSLKLYDVTGALVTTLASGYHAAGSYRYSLLSAHYSLAAGVYLLKFESDGFRTTRKLIVD